MRVGVLGSGQLGRLLAQAGAPLGHQFRFLAEGEVRGLAAEGRAALEGFARNVDLVTFESEAWEPETLAHLARSVTVYPPPAALATSQDRLPQKQLFQRLGLGTAPFVAVAAGASLARAAAELGLPAVLKLRRGGYDGRGQWLLRTPADVAEAQRELCGRAAILERCVPFARELSIVAVRGSRGQQAFYPLTQNHHERGCLFLSLAPAPACGHLRAKAEAMARAVLEELDYVGVLALELFECDGELLINELAPRVHNSGHWTIEGAETSQFENHLRAIVGLPLGSTRVLAPCVMLNLLGALPPSELVLAVPGAHLHLYGKAPAPGRKLGHVTLRAGDERELGLRLRQLAQALELRLPEAVRGWLPGLAVEARAEPLARAAPRADPAGASLP